jgi:hypothetical protein
LRLVAETDNPHDAAKARAFMKRVSNFVDAQFEAGALSVAAASVAPEEGELFRAVVTSDLLDSPHVMSERHSENE